MLPPIALEEEDRVLGKEFVTPIGSATAQGAFGRELYAHLSGMLEKGEIKVRSCMNPICGHG